MVVHVSPIKTNPSTTLTKHCLPSMRKIWRRCKRSYVQVIKVFRSGLLV